MWNTIQCAVQGRGHIKTQTPCQDKTYALFKNDIYVIALSDGAGSAQMSHYGAEYVTKQICGVLTDDFDMYYAEEDGSAIKRKIISDLLDGLQKIAINYGCDIKELASTLLVAAVKDDKYILIHIGDGVIGYLKDDEIKIASHPENGEFVNTTVFVTSRDVLHTMKILKGELGNIHGFALMSDGTETSFYNKKDKLLAPALKKLMKLSKIMEVSCLERETRKSFEDIIKNNTTDDCSIILLVEEDYSFHGYNLLPRKEKEIMLGYSNALLSKKRMQRFGEILNFLVFPNTLFSVSRKIYLKKKYTMKYIDVLLEQNLIVKNKEIYQTAVIMEK